MTNIFDPDNDPAQVAAAKAAAAKSLSEDDLLREDPANLIANPATPRDAFQGTVPGSITTTALGTVVVRYAASVSAAIAARAMRIMRVSLCLVIPRR